MNRRTALLAIAFGTGTLAAGGAGLRFGFPWSASAPDRRLSLLIGGAGAMFSLNQALAGAYMQRHPAVDVIVEKGSSLQGYIAAKRGAIDLAAMSRDLADEEDDEHARAYLIARGFVTLIVHPSSPIKNLSRRQVQGLLSGRIRNWREVGGANAPVTVISRTHASTTRRFVEQVVLGGEEFSPQAHEMESTRQLADAVAANPHAIGYIASNDSQGSAEVGYLSVDSVAASPETVLSGRYPLTQSFSLMAYGNVLPHAADFVAFARSPAGQGIVAKQGLVPVY